MCKPGMPTETRDHAFFPLPIFRIAGLDEVVVCDGGYEGLVLGAGCHYGEDSVDWTWWLRGGI
jgi:hypothetical protein